MARKKECPEGVDETLFNQLCDIAAGVEGCQGEVSLSAALADLYEALGGSEESMIDAGNGAVMVQCPALCEVCLVESEPASAESPKRGRRQRHARRS